MNVYEIVTNKIIEQLEHGVAPWRKPWHSEPPENLISGKPYRGINPFLLASQGCASKYWLTYAQGAKLGVRVRASEHSSMVTFWKISDFKRKNMDTGEEKDGKSVLLRYYSVFNVSQFDGLEEKLGLEGKPALPRIDECERIVAEMPNRPALRQDARAYYHPASDHIGMPQREAFVSSEAYYATLFHEMTHATGHASRVGRDGIDKLERFGSESYSKEELIAELGSAMLCGQAGISPAVLENSASYLQSWIQVLRGDSRLIVSAASAAQKAADFILGKVSNPTNEESN